jgi:hypothetical protein
MLFCSTQAYIIDLNFKKYNDKNVRYIHFLYYILNSA